MRNHQDIFDKAYYITDGGLETTLLFDKGFELNHFAAFELLNEAAGQQALEEYYQAYVNIAINNQLDFVLETPTWRTNDDWGVLLGYSSAQLAEINREAVYFVRQFVEKQPYSNDKFLISGNIGPRGDGYTAGDLMSVEEAKEYHTAQIQAFAYADADLVTAMTLNYVNEALGITKAAQRFGIPVVISFSVETDGNLPSGESLAYAIEVLDRQTGQYPNHFMINCAHPSHFKDILKHADGDWINRIKGIRANASCKSHEELDNSEVLDRGDKYQLAEDYLNLKQLLPNLKVVGGCCGTDHRHLEQICIAFFVNG